MMHKIGFTCGAFDLCHAGHMMMLKEAKSKCEYLIVGLQTDPSIDRPYKKKPILSVEERMMILESVKYVDKIMIYRTEADLLAILKELPPGTLRIIGDDWKGKDFTGFDLTMDVYFNKRLWHKLSSTELRERIKNA
jgi:glycerol-3-phosphate cytidylyltransferase